jgi:hypothetical protein
VLQTAANDEARFDHDPVNGNSRGLLIEEARTNSVQRSAEFDNAYWSKVNGSISANATTAPDGATSADRLVEDSTASVSHLVARSVAGVAPTQQLTGSCFIKADTRTFARIVVWDQNAAGNNVGATFDVSGGTVASAGANAGNATGASASITNVGNGWYRCSVSGIPNTSGSDSGLAIYLMSSGGGAGSTAYTGDGTSGLYIWGAQLEIGAFPTSYIPTTSAAATRSADSAVVTPISSFYNQSEGTLFAEASLPQTPNNAFAADIYTDVQNRIGILRGPNTANMNSFVFAGNVTQANLGNTVSAQPTKTALSFRTDDFASTTNGGTIATDSLGTLPVATSVRIGQRADGGQAANGHIRKIAYWPKRLTNTLLEQLTT